MKVCHSEEANSELYYLVYDNRPTRNLTFLEESYLSKGTIRMARQFEATVENLDKLLNDLRDASKVRNVLCHGSWRKHDHNGASIPFFVNRQQEIFDTAVANGQENSGSGSKRHN
jgi:hypothetical protein